MTRFLPTVLLCLIVGVTAWAQGDKVVTGKVTSADDGAGVPGVNVVVQGTTRGTSTDAEGNYSIQLAPNENVLVFTFIGFKTATVEVGERTTVDVTLESDIQSLDEVVVVGYGTQREKDLTSAISTIKTEELTKTPQGQVMTALQGKVPGLQVVNSGAPGSTPTIRIRGIGSMPDQGDTDPLYVVDGMFFDNIDFLNPGDIATLSVLKDASAAAIYGVRAANGVILITTRTGGYNQKAQVSYNGYYGVQVAQNVLKMSNSEQYSRYALATGTTAEATFVNNAFRFYGRSRVNPNVPNVNTDWYDQVLQTAPIQNHAVSLDGGGENVRYSIGASYFDQEGLLRVTKNNYERLNFRAKLDFNATERLSAGVNFNVSNAKQYNAEESVWGTTYYAVPIMPVLDEGNTLATPMKLASAKRLGYRDSKNPFFALYNNNNRNMIAKMLGNIYVEYQLIPDKLSFKTAYNFSNESIDAREVDFDYNDGFVQSQNALKRESKSYFNQIIDNTLTYTNDFGAHNITVMAGYSFRSELYDGTMTRGTNVPWLDRNREETWYLDLEGGPTGGPHIDINGSGDHGEKLFGASYLGRLAYNYDDRYLFYATLRRDGTNKFQKTWGNFVTFGAGWVLSEESFFDLPAINFLKLRGSWGQLGNDSVDPSIGRSTVEGTSTAIDNTNVPGIFIDTNFDYVDRWETVEETNVGLTGRFLEDRLSVELDYYVRDTEDAVLRVKLPASGEVVRRNGGVIRNSGLEGAFNWSGTIASGLTYNIGANFATLKNEAIDLRGQSYLNFGTAEFQQRTILGESLTAFYGYEVEGVFQNQQQIDNSGYSSEFIAGKGLVPGDFFFKDQNGDGTIDGNDRVIIGSILPNFSYGFDFSVAWKGLQLSANFQGMRGHSILNRKRGEINWTEDSNIDADLANNLWTGENTSNKYPAASGLRGTRKAWNNSMSTYLVEDGDYFRIQNVRVAYTITGKEVFGVNVPQTTFSLTAERPLTVFSYNGFNPEVSDGIDDQTYPIPAVYTVGLNVKF
ncbi:MAG TPA: TonB-dependent receptor [Ohtaekwangia sp.]|nr:TonB-dependent receptor [Ohtaekwangia sp.]